MKAPFRDNFNRADGLLGGQWVQQRATSNVYNNKFDARGTGGDYSWAYVNEGQTYKDQFAQMKVTNQINEGGITLRVSGSGATTSGYVLLGRDDIFAFYRVDNHSFTGLGNMSTVVVGDVLLGIIEGSTMRAYKNGVLIGSVTDTTYTSGYFGIMGLNNTADGTGYNADDYIGGAYPYTATLPNSGIRPRAFAPGLAR